MAGQGPAHLFVYYQKPYKINDQGEVQEERAPADFVVTYGKCLCADSNGLAGGKILEFKSVNEPTRRFN